MRSGDKTSVNRVPVDVGRRFGHHRAEPVERERQDRSSHSFADSSTAGGRRQP
jgi:hypothetical protein